MRKKGCFLGFGILLTLVFVACGKTTTVGPTYSVSGAVITPNFVVFIFCDANINCAQPFSAAAPVNNPSNLQYYYTAQPIYLKKCAIGQGQVATDPSLSASVSDCTSLATNLEQTGVFPPTQDELNRSGVPLKISSDGFIYSYFFYNPTLTPSNRPADVPGGQSIPTTTRCFKFWGAAVHGGEVVDSAGTQVADTAAVDITNLTCFGF